MYSILYVDDEPAQLELMRLFLEGLGTFRVRTATTTDEAFRLASVVAFDAIISDYQMLGMDGIRFLSEVRQRFGDIPFILFTGRGREEVVIAAIKGEADFYLQKSGSPEALYAELGDKIRQAVTRRQADKDLVLNEARCRSIIDEQAELIIRFSPEGTVTFANAAYRRYARSILGLEQIEGTNILQYLRSIGERIDEELASLTPESPTFMIEHTQVGPDGDRCWQLWTVRAIHESDGTISDYQLVGRDVSDQHKTETALVESENRLRSFIDASLEAVVIVGEGGLVIEWNPAAERLLGIPADEALGRPIGDLLIDCIPDDQRSVPHDESVKRAIRSSLRGNHHSPEQPLVLEIQNRDGNRLWVRLTLFPIQCADGCRYGAIAQDVTYAKRAEHALRHSEAWFRSIVETSPNMIWEVDLEGRFRYISPIIKPLMGYEPDELIGRPITDLVTAEGREYAMRELHRHLASPEPPGAIEVPGQHRDGHTMAIEIRPRPYFENGNLVGIRGVAIDISDRKRTEEALRLTSHKLGLLSSITRHDVLNKTTVVRGYLDLAASEIDDPRTLDLLRHVQIHTREIEAEMRFAQQYQDIGTQAPEWIQVTDVLPRTMVPPAVDLVAHIDGVTIFADRMLEQVFANLMENSVRYGETLTELRVSYRIEDGCLVLSWEDDGVGVPADSKETIFERGVGTHTGLGLFLSREILALTGITIREVGQPGEGAHFEISVPFGGYRIAE